VKRTALRRTTRLSPRSAKALAAAASHDVTRHLVFARDGHRCQVAVVAAATGRALGGCYGPLTPHHRRKASAGGAYRVPNLVTACSQHNDAMEADADLAAWAHTVGLVVRRGDPEWAELGQ
jgi:hypothetical protein